MPRLYNPPLGAKKYKKYDQLIINQALEELSSNRHETLRSIALKYKISKSVLQRHNTRVMKPSGGQISLSIDIEEHIVRNLNVCSEWGYPLDILDLRLIIKTYLDSLGITHKRFKNNLPGRDYVQNFLKRHKDKISQRICQNIKRSRAAITPETITDYFSELHKSLDNVPLGNILNYDETNLSDDPGRKKVITKRGCKYPERVVNHSKASVSIMMAGTAEGELLPPYVCYKATHLYDTWRLNGPSGSRYNRTPSGWFDAEVFKDWVTTIVLPFFENKIGKKLLIGDNLSSHLSLELISLCKERDVHFVFLPANSTHITQPLDVAFFRPMKIAWRQILTKWKKTDGRSQTTVPKGCFPRLLKMLMKQLQDNAQNNLKAGFRKTGISPFNPDEVLSRLPQDSIDQNQEREAIDQSVLNLLKEMRFGTMNIVEPKKKRKLNVVSGRSVCNEIVENLEEAGPSAMKKTQKGKGKGKTSVANKKEESRTDTTGKVEIKERKETVLKKIKCRKDVNNEKHKINGSNMEHSDCTENEFDNLDQDKEFIAKNKEQPSLKKKHFIEITGNNSCNDDEEICNDMESGSSAENKTLKAKGKGKKTRPLFNNSEVNIENNSDITERIQIMEKNEYELDKYNEELEVKASNTDHSYYTGNKICILDQDIELETKSHYEEQCVKKTNEPVNNTSKILGEHNIEKETEMSVKNVRVDQARAVNKSRGFDLENINIEEIPVVQAEDLICENFLLENINIENMPIIASDDLQVYEEIILEDPLVDTAIKQINDGIENPKIVDNVKLSEDSVRTLCRNTDLKYSKKVSLNTKVQKTSTSKNFYNNREEILKILEQD